MRRVVQYVILLPRYFNDGRPVPSARFVETYQELVEYFGGATIDTIQVLGQWQIEGELYEDRLRRLTVTGEESPETDAFVRAFKETLKERFEQKDVWITAQRIDVI